MKTRCAGSTAPAAMEADGRARCPYCGHRINVTTTGKLFGHNGRRASAPRKSNGPLAVDVVNEMSDNVIRAGDRCTVKRHRDERTSISRIARVMAVAEGYAMVRYSRAMPFVEPIKELTRVQ